ncbi:hypothetical protein AB0F64_22335 [Streptomyces sp. NPDC026294]|uniref:hypothetical protein n=1 Tax=Streptomyces sp. NPDC026294 TaxID=3155362 RepID=UPI0033CC573E
MCDAVAARLGEPVRIVPTRLGGTTSGLTSRTADGYRIFCERRTAPWHRAHTVLVALLMERVAPSAPDHGPGPTGRAAGLAAAREPALRHRRAERNGTGRAGGADGKDDAASGAGTVTTDGGTGV